jgi:ABC-2 type transport system permease protein
VSAVFIVWLRQLKRYFRSRARMLGSLGQPTLFLLALGFGLGPTFARAGRGDYIQFLAPGIVTMAILFTAVFSGIEIIWAPDRHARGRGVALGRFESRRL